MERSDFVWLFLLGMATAFLIDNAIAQRTRVVVVPLEGPSWLPMDDVALREHTMQQEGESNG